MNDESAASVSSPSAGNRKRAWREGNERGGGSAPKRSPASQPGPSLLKNKLARRSAGEGGADRAGPSLFKVYDRSIPKQVLPRAWQATRCPPGLGLRRPLRRAPFAPRPPRFLPLCGLEGGGGDAGKPPAPLTCREQLLPRRPSAQSRALLPAPPPALPPLAGGRSSAASPRPGPGAPAPTAERGPHAKGCALRPSGQAAGAGARTHARVASPAPPLQQARLLPQMNPAGRAARLLCSALQRVGRDARLVRRARAAGPNWWAGGELQGKPTAHPRTRRPAAGSEGPPGLRSSTWTEGSVARWQSPGGLLLPRPSLVDMGRARAACEPVRVSGSETWTSKSCVQVPARQPHHISRTFPWKEVPQISVGFTPVQHRNFSLSETSIAPICTIWSELKLACLWSACRYSYS